MTILALANSTPMNAAHGPIDWPAELETNRRWLETVVRSRLGDAHAAEDVIQEMAVAVLRQTNRPVDPAKAAPWLYRIALRKAINHRRFLGRQRHLMDRYSRDIECGNAQCGLPSGEHWLMQCERQLGLQNAMKFLSNHDREILLLKYSENWSYRQLAERLGVSVKTIEYRLLRARDALREQMSNQLD